MQDFPKCRYPKCNDEGVTTFGLVPLCIHHKKLIVNETKEYYKRGTPYYYDRKHYLEIAHLIPWSKYNEDCEINQD